MLPGFTGSSSEGHHTAVNYRAPNPGFLATNNQGISLAGGSGPGGNCPAGCSARKSKCVGTYQYWYCICNGQVLYEYAYGDCFIWSW